MHDDTCCVSVGAECAEAQRPSAAKTVFRGLVDVLLFALVVFEPSMAAAIELIAVINHVHAKTLIGRGHAQLRTISPRSADSFFVRTVITRKSPIIVIVIALLFLEVAVLIRKVTKLHESFLIVEDAISMRSWLWQCA